MEDYLRFEHILSNSTVVIFDFPKFLIRLNPFRNMKAVPICIIGLAMEVHLVVVFVQEFDCHATPSVDACPLVVSAAEWVHGSA